MRYRRSIAEGEEVSDINISPLIDMVFILLLFFIVTTTFIEETGVEVQKPEAASAIQLEKNSILIAVTREGYVVHGGDNIGAGRVRELVRRLTQKEKLPVIIQVDEKADAGLVVRVIDESNLGGAESVSLSTEMATGQ